MKALKRFNGLPCEILTGGLAGIKKVSTPERVTKQENTSENPSPAIKTEDFDLPDPQKHTKYKQKHPRSEVRSEAQPGDCT